jgi:hypothetical protein
MEQHDFRLSFRMATALSLENKSPFDTTSPDLLANDKGPDCESAGAAHDWYNHDDETSHCYHCQVERPGELWRKDSIGAPFLPPPRH